MSNPSIDELAAVLQEFAPTEKHVERSPLEERIITGFEEIQQFTTKHEREPSSDSSNDILERIYATRLKRLRTHEAALAILTPLDHQGLLSSPTTVDKSPDEMTPEELLAALTDSGIDGGAPDITRLEYVRPFESRQAPDEVAVRKPCKDFHLYKDMFQQVIKEVAQGARGTKPFESKSEIFEGGLYIIEGQTAFVAGIGEEFTDAHGRKDARLHVIYDNGTESNLLLWSLQKALSQDPTARIVLDPGSQQLFTNEVDEDDQPSGVIYVLKSKSEHPAIIEHKELLHKIGVTTSNVKQRIANAKKDPTFLMADVEIVATYELYNINRKKLEQILHRVFDPARLDVKINDRFGQPITPREWFLVPLFAIQEAISRIRDGSITNYQYDPSTASLIKHNG